MDGGAVALGAVFSVPLGIEFVAAFPELFLLKLFSSWSICLCCINFCVSSIRHHKPPSSAVHPLLPTTESNNTAGNETGGNGQAALFRPERVRGEEGKLPSSPPPPPGTQTTLTFRADGRRRTTTEGESRCFLRFDPRRTTTATTSDGAATATIDLGWLRREAAAPRVDSGSHIMRW